MTLLERKLRAKAYIKGVRLETNCQKCGKQPIDWHRKEHETNHNMRIGPRMSRGNSPKVLQTEIDLCTPLCRYCHMKEDGRLEALIANRPYKKGDTQPPKLCFVCGNLAKPLRKGRCNKCNHRFRKQTGS